MLALKVATLANSIIGTEAIKFGIVIRALDRRNLKGFLLQVKEVASGLGVITTVKVGTGVLVISYYLHSVFTN